MALVEIEKLTSHYGRIPALRGVDMRIEERQLSVLVGANGAGKTTLMRTISGVRPASGGDIRFEGASIRRLSAAKRVRLGIAQVPEGRQMFPALTVEDNLVMGGYTRTGAEIREGIERAFALFPVLAERRDQRGGTLSGGEQQMLAIARALMLNPRLMLLDEPSFGLAPLIVVEIFRILRRINEEERVSILLVEQNAALALELATHAYVLETGKVVMSGPSEVIKNDENVRKSYLGY